MFRGRLSDVWWCGGGGVGGQNWVNTAGGSAQRALHHPVDLRRREAVGLQQGGRWSFNASEGFDLRPHTDLYCNNLTPKIPQRTNNNLRGLPFISDTLTSHPVLFFLSSHCSHPPFSTVLNEKQPAETSLTSSPFLCYTLSSFILFESFFFLPGSSLSKASACLFFFFTLFRIFHSLISLSLMVSWTQIKPSLQFSSSSHLASNDPSASLSCSLHSALIALSLLSTWEKLTPLSYPH